MTDDDLLAHLKDILNCCGVSRAQTTIGGMDRFRLAVNMAVAEERERCAGIAEGERLASTEPAAKAAARLIEAVIRGRTTSPAGG